MSGFLDALHDAPRIAPRDLLGGRPLCVLAPHPDDETLGCGALIFDAARAGTPCQVICITDGAASHPRSQSHAAPRLADLRRREVEAACAVLDAGTTIAWLGHPDSDAPDSDAVAADIAARVARDALVMATWAGDPHVDHVRTAGLARRVARLRPDLALAFYPVWGRFADRPAPRARLLTASPAARAAKARALACHASQMTPLIRDDPAGFVMAADHQSHFLQHPEIVLAA